MSTLPPEATAAAKALLSPKDPDHDCKSPTPEQESEEEDDPINIIKGDLFSAPDGSVLIHACNTQGKWGAGIALEFKKRYPKAFEIYARACVPRPPPPKVSGGLWPRPLRPSEYPQEPDSHSGYRINGVFREFSGPVVGTCLLIPPQEGDYGRVVPAGRKRKRTSGQQRSKNASTKGKKRVKKHWIACLFTSEGYGKAKSVQLDILENTRTAMEDLVVDIEELAEDLEQRESEGFDGEDEVEEGWHGVAGELWACKFNSGKFGVEWEETEEVVRAVLEKSGYTLKVVERDGDEDTSGQSDGYD